jgi:hypothetical protein
MDDDNSAFGRTISALV